MVWKKGLESGSYSSLQAKRMALLLAVFTLYLGSEPVLGVKGGGVLAHLKQLPLVERR